MMVKFSALNDFGEEMVFVTLTDLPLSTDIDSDLSKHPLVKQALKLLAMEVEHKMGTARG